MNKMFLQFFKPSKYNNGRLKFKRILLTVFLISFLFASMSSKATHFVSGTINWEKDLTFVSATDVRIIFKINSAWRWDFSGYSPLFPSVGSTLSFGIPLNIVGTGYSTSNSINMVVKSVNASENWFAAETIFTVVLPISGYPFNASFQSCCRSSFLSNNADLNFRVETTVTAGNNHSPVCNLLPVIYFTTNSNSVFVIPATDSDSDPITFTFASSATTGGGSTQPPGLDIVGNTLVFNTLGKPDNSIWNAIINISDDKGGVIAFDMQLRVIAPSPTAAPSFIAPSPANGTQFNVRPLNNVSFSIKASDPNVGDIVNIDSTPIPLGASFTQVTGNPCDANFTWTPTAAQIGTYFICFQASDNFNHSTASQYCLQINVSEDPEFIAPTFGDGSILCATPGDPISTVFKASDLNVNNTVSLSAESGVLPGMIFSPVLPTPSANPVTTNFNWTPSVTDWGAKTLMMKATSQLGYFKNTSVTWVVNTRPIITSTPVSTSLIVGQLFSYTLTVADPDIVQGDHISIETSVLPDFLTIVDNGDNTFTISGTPTVGDLGPHSVDVELEDLLNHYNGTHCGNVHQALSLVVVGEAPAIFCPSNITVDNTLGECGAFVSFTATETTGIPASTIIYSPASGSFFPIGSTTVTATATNLLGTSECIFTVTVASTFATTNISGHVYVDSDGGTIGGTLLPSSVTNAWISLFKGANIITPTQVVNVVDGAFTFAPVPDDNYTLVMGTSPLGSYSPSFPIVNGIAMQASAEGQIGGIGDAVANGKAQLTILACNASYGNARLAVTGNIDFGIKPAPALPVRLISFEGKATEKGNELEWETSSEQNFSHYELERSKDLKAFVQIAKINGRQNSKENLIYTFLDLDFDGSGKLAGDHVNSTPNREAYYRLKMMDLDGLHEYSPIVFIKNNNVPEIYVYPNPASDFIWISNPLNQLLKIKLLDSIGREILGHEKSSESVIKIPVAIIGSGAYFLEIQNGVQTLYKKILLSK